MPQGFVRREVLVLVVGSELGVDAPDHVVDLLRVDGFRLAERGQGAVSGVGRIVLAAGRARAAGWLSGLCAHVFRLCA